MGCWCYCERCFTNRVWLYKSRKATEQIDPPKQVTYTEGGKKEVAKKDKQGQMVNRELYLVDKNGYVVPQTLAIPTPKANETVKQTLEYLVKDGSVTNLLPNGFRAVIPANTTMTLDLKRTERQLLISLKK